MNREIIVFIPAYNEVEAIGNVINEINKLCLNLQIFVIDDGSRDGTYEAAKRQGAIIISHPINLGGGASIRTAFQIALLQKSKYIITMDGDGQHDPKDLPKMIDALKNEDAALVIGSRFLGNNVITMKKYRNYGIKFFSRLISILIGHKLTDVTSCYRIYDSKYIKLIQPFLKENQYYALEIILQISKCKGKIIEVPIKDLRRTSGESKKGVIRYFYNLIRVVIIRHMLE